MTEVEIPPPIRGAVTMTMSADLVVAAYFALRDAEERYERNLQEQTIMLARRMQSASTPASVIEVLREDITFLSSARSDAMAAGDFLLAMIRRQAEREVRGGS